MKAHSKVIVVVALLLSVVFTLQAQNKNVDVKILPATEEGFIKVMFVADNSSDVQVKFYNYEGLYTVDQVDKKLFTKGFIKKYDIRNVERGESFWIEVSTNDLVTTYKISQPKTFVFVPHLERTEFTNVARLALKD